MSRPDILSAIFWGSALMLGYTFAGYGVVVEILGRICRRTPAKLPPSNLPSVSVVIVAHNEAARIADRVKNLLASDYTPDRLQIVLVSDGSTDATAEEAKAASQTRIQVVALAERAGKARGLNAGVALATGEIVIFADARQQFNPDAIRQLVGNFSDAKVGAVSGNHTMESASSNVGAGVDAYWKLEKKIRLAESQLDSSIGCTGAIYALRRALFQPIPEDTLLDDVVIPMQVAVKGYRVVFEPEAKCFDPLPSEPAREKNRKKRTLAGNFQMLFRHPAWLLPWKNRLWWQLISHKYLRIAAPLFLGLLLAANIGLARQPFYFVLLLGHVLCYLLAMIGILLPSLKVRLFSIPAGFFFLNGMTVAGFYSYLSGRYRGGRW